MIVTSQVAVLVLSAADFTVMVAAPAATPVTTPASETVAMLVLLDSHVTFLFVAFAGATVAMRVSVLPILMFVEALFSETPLTAVGLTVTLHVAVLVSSAADFTVIVAEPTPTAVTTPSSTVATSSSLDSHVTFLFVASAGATVAVSVSVSPTSSVADVLSKNTLVTATAALTVTSHVALIVPSEGDAAVIVAVPSATPVTTPFTTVATSSSLDDQTTLSVAFVGVKVGLKVTVPPTPIEAEDLSKEMAVMATVASV